MKTEEENAKKSKKNNKKIIVLLVLIIIIIYSLVILYNLIKNPTDTFLVENGEIFSEESTTGYIIRDETIVEGNNYKNGMIYIKSELDKVAKGESVFRYYSNNEEELIKKINDLDVKIQEAMSKENNIFSSDIKLLDNQIEQRLMDIYEQNDIQKIKEYKKDINTYITKKAKIAGDLSPSGSYIKKLIDERSKYENELNNGSEYIKAPKSGVLSYRVDGLEDVLTTNDFSKLNKSFLDGLKLKTSQIIATSDEKGKIVDNFKCYLTCIIKSEKARETKVGDKVKIRLPNSEEVIAYIEYISIEDDDEVVLVFRINNCVEELIQYRKITFDIIWWSDKGLKVQNSAIIEEDDISYVIRNRAGYLEKIYIKVLRKNENYSIVSNYTSKELQEKGLNSDKIENKKSIAAYDEIILKPVVDKLKISK